MKCVIWPSASHSHITCLIKNVHDIGRNRCVIIGLSVGVIAPIGLYVKLG